MVFKSLRGFSLCAHRKSFYAFKNRDKIVEYIELLHLSIIKVPTVHFLQKTVAAQRLRLFSNSSPTDIHTKINVLKQSHGLPKYEGAHLIQDPRGKDHQVKVKLLQSSPRVFGMRTDHWGSE